MKKRILALLLGLLLFSMWAIPMGIAEDTSGLYYLWDIPFGISESEFIEQAYAKTGFNFLPQSGEVGNSFEITTDKKQSISFLGHPLSEVRAAFLMDSQGKANYYGIFLVFSSETKMISEAISLFDSVRLALTAKYGDPTFVALSNNKAEFLTCDAIEGDFNAQQVADILTTDNTLDMITMAWRNLGIGVGKRSYTEGIMVLYALTSITDTPEPLKVYENRNMPTDAGL